MLRLITYLGPLRALLMLATILVIATGPFFGGEHESTWGFYTNLIAPTLVVLLLFVLPLDMLMTGIFMSEATARDRQRLRHALLVEVVLYSMLIAVWFPLLRSLLLAKPVL